MQIFDLQALQLKYAEAKVKVDATFLRQSRLVPNLTILKLGEYNLNTAPAFLSFSEIQTLAVLSPNEAALFSRYSSVVNTLILNFEQPEKTEPLRFHIHVNLLAIESVPQRKNICMIRLKAKTVPGEFIRILGSYLDEVEHRKETYERLGTSVIEINTESAKLLGYSDIAELIYGESRQKVTLKSFSSTTARIQIPGGAAPWTDKTPLFLKLHFQTVQPSLEAKLGPLSDPPDEAPVALGFNPDLLEIIEDYQFKSKMVLKSHQPPESQG